jgi:NAD(P)-dependent dehydrogenase (short-subunit alcohol dehydrogenase family)
MELAEYGIRVNSLTPTATDVTEGMARATEWGVPFRRPGNPSPRRRGFLSGATPGVPLGKRPSPADYASAAVFLASDAAAMITGTDLRVDAGALARYWMWDPSVPPA